MLKYTHQITANDAAEVKMKKTTVILAVLLAFAAVFCFAACEKSEPEKPEEKPVYSEEQMQGFFTYSVETFEGKEYVYITGVTDEAKKLTVLEVPAKYDGKDVYGFASGCFAGCENMKTLYVHSNIREWQGKLFEGCKSLKKIYMDYTDFVAAAKTDTALGDAFTCASSSDGDVYGKGSILEGLKGVKFVFTDADVYDFFDVNYSWAAYSSVFTKE